MTNCAPAPDVLFRIVDDEALLLDVRSGRYFSLDEVGTRIWELVDRHRSASAVVQSLDQEYDAELAVLWTDVQDFLATLARNDLLVLES